MLSSGNVREISLIYDLSEYFSLVHKHKDLEREAKIRGESASIVLKREMLTDRLDTFKQHFSRYKKGYFLNRGFVTFTTHRVALEMKEVFKKAYRERRQGLLDEIVMKIKGEDRTPESAVRRKFRRIVMEKVIGVHTKGRKDHLSLISNLLIGSKGDPSKTKSRIMRDESGDKVGRFYQVSTEQRSSR